MFGFNQFFSGFGFQQPSIDPILERAEGIDDILDEDNIITIVKSQAATQKFGDYIRKHPDMIQKLVKYIIEEPELHEQMDSKRCFKYPFISSELFYCEIPLLINSLFEDLRTMSPTKQDEDDNVDDNKVNEFIGLSRQKQFERVSGKMNDNEEIVEQIDINCEDNEQNNEFFEKENEEKDEKQENDQEEKENEEKEDYMPEVNKYVDETIKNVIQKLTNQEPKETIKNDESHEYNKSCNSLNEEDQQKPTEPILQLESFEMVGIQLMDYLLSFLKGKVELNETSAGYWAKVITAIINKRGTDFMDYLAENANNESFDCMMNFICCKSVADIVLKLILLEVPSLEAKKILYYVFIYNKELNQCKNYIRNFLLPKIHMQILYYCQFVQELENISFVLSEIFNKYQNQYNGSQELVEFILTEENLNILFKIIIDEKDSTLYIYSLKILESIFKFFNQTEETQLFTENKDDEIKQNLQQLLKESNLQNCFSNFLKELILKLNEEQNQDEVKLQFNIRIKPFGLGKLKLLEILYFGLKNQLTTSTESIEDNLKTTNFFKILMDFVIKYEWNNFVHNIVEKIILLVLWTSCGVRKQLFSNECNLLQIIMDNLAQLHFFLTPERPYRATHGNLMIFLKFGNEIMKLKSKEDDYIVGIVEGDSKWQKFYDDVLGKLNKEMSQDLGGVNPREKKVVACENEREIDLANIFKKFSAFFSNSSLGGTLNNNANNDNADDNDDKKKDGEEEDGDYNQLGKKYEEDEDDDEFDREDENNYDPNEEIHDELKENMSVQQLKLQQLTTGGTLIAPIHASKAKNERNAAYAAYGLKQENNEEKKEEEEEEEKTNQYLQEKFTKNIQKLKHKQQRLLKDMNKNNKDIELDNVEEYEKNQLQDEIQNQLDHMLEPKYYYNQFWDATDYNSVDISDEIADLL